METTKPRIPEGRLGRGGPGLWTRARAERAHLASTPGLPAAGMHQAGPIGTVSTEGWYSGHL